MSVSCRSIKYEGADLVLVYSARGLKQTCREVDLIALRYEWEKKTMSRQMGVEESEY